MVAEVRDSLQGRTILGSMCPKWRCRCEKLLPGKVFINFLQENDNSYSVALEIAAVQEKDLAATFSLNVTNTYGFQVFSNNPLSFVNPVISDLPIQPIC